MKSLSLYAIRVRSFMASNANNMLLLAGVTLLFGGLLIAPDAITQDTQTYSRANYEEALVSNAVGMLFRLIEGSFGALVMVVAGLGAIVAAAMGAYRLAISMLVVAVGAFILRALVSLFFGAGFEQYQNGV